MGSKRSKRRVAAAVVAIAGLAGGAVVAGAATFSDRATDPNGQNLALGGPVGGFPSLPMTCTANCAITLEAAASTVTVPDSTVVLQPSIPFWGWKLNGGAPSLASPASAIKVPLGTVLTITLSSTLPLAAGAVELSFPSIPAANVAHVGNTYTVTASTLGTSVYQAGVTAQGPRQVAMGLVGALIVTPVGCNSCAYDATPHADEALVAITDLDAAFAANPTTYDMSYFGQPKAADGSKRSVYHVINGKAFPQTDVIDVKAGDNALVRYVNASVKDKSMGILGLHQTILGRNANVYPHAQSVVAPLITPGETADVAIAVPSSIPAGQRFSLMDQGRQMNDEAPNGFGGALTFVNVWAGTIVGPSITSAAYAITTGLLSGVAAPSAPAYPVTKIEYSLTGGAPWSPGATGPAITAFSFPVTLTGPATITVQATDSNNNTATKTVVVAAPAGPTTVLNAVVAGAPATINGTATAAAGLSVSAGEYWLGAVAPVAGSGTAMTNAAGALSASATLVSGNVVNVRAKDSWGTWGVVTTVTVP